LIFFFGLWVFVWGIENLDLYRYCVFVFVVVVVVVVSVILAAGDNLQERERKKNIFYSENDEQ
jgi:nitrate/nitrite transporter NarK